MNSQPPKDTAPSSENGKGSAAIDDTPDPPASENGEKAGWCKFSLVASIIVGLSAWAVAMTILYAQERANNEEDKNYDQQDDQSPHIYDDTFVNLGMGTMEDQTGVESDFADMFKASHNWTSCSDVPGSEHGACVKGDTFCVPSNPGPCFSRFTPPTVFFHEGTSCEELGFDQHISVGQTISSGRMLMSPQLVKTLRVCTKPSTNPDLVANCSISSFTVMAVDRLVCEPTKLSKEAELKIEESYNSTAAPLSSCAESGHTQAVTLNARGKDAVLCFVPGKVNLDELESGRSLQVTGCPFPLWDDPGYDQNAAFYDEIRGLTVGFLGAFAASTGGPFASFGVNTVLGQIFPALGQPGSSVTAASLNDFAAWVYEQLENVVNEAVFRSLSNDLTAHFNTLEGNLQFFQISLNTADEHIQGGEEDLALDSLVGADEQLARASATCDTLLSYLEVGVTTAGLEAFVLDLFPYLLGAGHICIQVRLWSSYFYREVFFGRLTIPEGNVRNENEFHNLRVNSWIRLYEDASSALLDYRASLIFEMFFHDTYTCQPCDRSECCWGLPSWLHFTCRGDYKGDVYYLEDGDPDCNVRAAGIGALGDLREVKTRCVTNRNTNNDPIARVAQNYQSWYLNTAIHVTEDNIIPALGGDAMKLWRYWNPTLIHPPEEFSVPRLVTKTRYSPHLLAPYRRLNFGSTRSSNNQRDHHHTTSTTATSSSRGNREIDFVAGGRGDGVVILVYRYETRMYNFGAGSRGGFLGGCGRCNTDSDQLHTFELDVRPPASAPLGTVYRITGFAFRPGRGISFTISEIDPDGVYVQEVMKWTVGLGPNYGTLDGGTAFGDPTLASSNSDLTAALEDSYAAVPPNAGGETTPFITGVTAVWNDWEGEFYHIVPFWQVQIYD